MLAAGWRIRSASSFVCSAKLWQHMCMDCVTWRAQGEVVTVGKESFTLAAGGRVLAARTQVRVLHEQPWSAKHACRTCAIQAPLVPTLALSPATLDFEQAQGVCMELCAVRAVLSTSGCLGNSNFFAPGPGAAGAGLGAERAQVAGRDAGPRGDQPGARV